MYPAADRRTSGSHSGSSNYTLVIVSFLITVFLALMNLKFQPANTQSPFETHGLIMAMFVTTILVYALILLGPPFSPEFTSEISILSGSLAPVLLSLILFPGLGRFILLIWVFYLVKLIYDACAKLFQLYEQRSSSYVSFYRLLLAHPAYHDEQTNRNNGRHAILGFPITVFLGLMPLRFRSREEHIAALFDTQSGHTCNNWLMSIFMVTTLIYTVACMVEAKLGRTGSNTSYLAVIISKICLLSGSFATVLLVLIIVRPLGWFTLLLWSLFFVKLIYHGCQELHQLYHAISTVSNFFNQVLGNRGHQNGQRIGLPV